MADRDFLAGVNTQLASAAMAIINASGGRIWIARPQYRTYAEQQRLYNRYLAGQGAEAAKPGTSLHERGLAIDFSGDMNLLAQLGPKFGLVNSVDGEPWHWTLSGMGEASDSGLPGVVGDPATRAKEVYGYLGWFVDHPVIGPILLQAASEGWSAERLQGALAGTDWWKTTSESSRQWDALKASDPATAERRLDETTLSLSLSAEKFGIDIKADRLGQLAESTLRFGWNPQEMQVALAAEMRWRPKSVEKGAVGALMQGVRKLGAEYMITVTPRQEWEWARRIVSGAATLEDVKVQFQTLAGKRFPHLRKDIDAGFSPALTFSPMRNAIAQVLEVAPDAINLMDKRWSPVTSYADKSGAVRPMTFTEAQRLARMQPEWLTTNNAWETLTQSAGGILEMFGATG